MTNAVVNPCKRQCHMKKSSYSKMVGARGIGGCNGFKAIGEVNHFMH